jgi:hypothetical protein
MDVVLTTVALLLLLGVTLWWSKRKPVRRPARISPTLHAAARRGDVELLAELLRAGADVDALDADRNTALHLAYYENRPDAVAWLTRHGATTLWRNRYGFTPAEMPKFAEVVRLLRRGADALTPVGGAHKPIGTSLPEKLRAAPVEMYLAALDRLATVDPAKHRVVYLAIKLGIPGTEELLCDLLWRVGTQSTAEVYLNSGSAALRACAQEWAAINRYHIVDGTGHHHVTWGVL